MRARVVGRSRARRWERSSTWRRHNLRLCYVLDLCGNRTTNAKIGTNFPMRRAWDLCTRTTKEQRTRALLAHFEVGII